MVPNSWRALKTFWALSLALMVCLGAGSGSLRSQERLEANIAASHEAVGLAARSQAFEPDQGRDGSNRVQDPPKACNDNSAKVRYLMDELSTQRFESARLTTDLDEAKAEVAEIKEASRHQEALLSALIAVLATRDRHDVIVRSENADTRQRLKAAQAELRRKVAENDRLAAELALARKAADSATTIALENLAVINAQIAAFHAAAGKATLEQANQRAGELSALWVDLPAMRRQKSHLEQ